MDEFVSFGSWLKTRRRALDLTQAELARQVGCALSTIKKVEQDERRPSREIAELLAEVLQLPLEERAAFVQSARGLRAVDRLAAPTPAVPTAGAQRRLTNLPLQRTPLIGRVDELASLRALLLREDVAMVTLTGPGGVGKTRLALQVVAELLDDFVDGVWLVELAPVSDPLLVASTIAQTLGVTDVASQPLLQTLSAYLREKQLLLLLDNFEQVTAAGPLVADLLKGAANLTILVTSRSLLRLRDEHDYPVLPLTLPDLHRQESLDTLSQYAAVALFIQRARLVKPDFQVTNDNAPAVAEICVRLDGLPLAIELASARLRLFAPQALLNRLTHRLQVLTGGARDLPARHQTIRDTIAWSYDLLEPEAQRLFVRLAVFVGGWTVEAAEAVCDADLGLETLDGLQLLLDQSLVRQAEDVQGEPRFHRLETIQEYGREQLAASPEAEAQQRRHAEYFVALAEQAEGQRGPEQRKWLERLEAEQDNLRAALAWSLGEPSSGQAGSGRAADIELGVRLVGALWQPWLVRGSVEEWRRWAAVATANPDTAMYVPPHVWARALLALALLEDRGDGRLAMTLAAQSLEFFQAVEDRWGCAMALGLSGGPYDAQASVHLEESLRYAREGGDPWRIAWSLETLAFRVWRQGDMRRTAELYEESLTLQRARGDKSGVLFSLSILSNVAFDQGNYLRARALTEERLGIEQAIGNKGGVAHALGRLGDMAWAQGDNAQAVALYEQSRALAEQEGLAPDPFLALRLGQVAFTQGDYASAWLEEALARYREDDNLLFTVFALISLGQLAHAQGDDGQATAHFRESLVRLRDLGDKPNIAECLEGLATVAGAQWDPRRAARLFGAAEGQREAMGTAIELPYRAGYGRDVEIARTQLDDVTWDAEWAEGRAMSLEYAVVYALREIPDG